MLRRLSSALRNIGSKVSRNEECNVIIVGLDNGGKTTIINWLQSSKGNDDAEQVAPTIGFKVESFSRNRLNFTAFDMSGQGKYRNMWEKQYSEVHAVIFVIDATDHMRLCVAKDELEMLLENNAIQSTMVPILFLANKMDDPKSLGADIIAKEMGLDQVHNRAWAILSTSAKTGEGIDTAFHWLSDNISASESKNHK